MRAVRLALISCFFVLISMRPIHAETENGADAPLLVFAAASMIGPLEEIAAAWSDATGHPEPKRSVAASAILARQIEAGAPADIFISANQTWSDYILQKGLSTGSGTFFAKNRLVLAARDEHVANSQDITAVVKPFISQRFGMADPAIAPAGQYAKDMLVSLGLWETASQHAAFGGNARQTLALVERGGIAGFLYASDVMSSTLAMPILTIPQEYHAPIQYRALVLKRSINEEQAHDFLTWLTLPEAQKILVKHGFQPK